MVLFLSFLSPVSSMPQGAASLRFRFAFGALTGSGPNQRLTRISQDTTLRTGDKIRLMVEMQQAGFVYLIHRGPANSIDLLFPQDLKQTLQVGRKYYVPDGTDWLEFDDTRGAESFYVLGSVQRLRSLESMLGRYQSATAAAKTGIAAEIVAEIRKLRAQNAATAEADRPVIIGGNVRGVDEIPVRGAPDVASLAVDVSVNGFYGRTFTIEHR